MCAAGFPLQMFPKPMDGGAGGLLRESRAGVPGLPLHMTANMWRSVTIRIQLKCRLGVKGENFPHQLISKQTPRYFIPSQILYFFPCFIARNYELAFQPTPTGIFVEKYIEHETAVVCLAAPELFQSPSKEKILGVNRNSTGLSKK